MNVRKKQWFSILLCLVFVLIFYFARYGSVKGQVILGSILAIFFLVLGIGTLFFSKSKSATIFCLIIFVGLIFTMLANYVDFKNLQFNAAINYIFIALTPPGAILLFIFANKYTATRNKYSSEKMNERKRKFILLVISASVFELVLLYKCYLVLFNIN